MNVSFLKRDPAYDHRKVLNSEDVILVAKQMGMTYDQIATVCKVSKTMVSHWGNVNRKERPTLVQINPLINTLGQGRFELSLEPISKAAISYPPWRTIVATAATLVMLVGLVSWFFMTACDGFEADSQCHNEPFLKRPFYVFTLASEGRVTVNDSAAEP
jgi:hypothetical protein